MKPAAASRTPSSRNWSSPCEDASIAACATPARARPASVSARVTGSGVVRPGPGSKPGAIRPSVPRLAALVPPAAQIWRRNSTVLVLPLVPVTATTVAGCGPASAAAICASRRRGSGSRISGRGGTPCGQSVPCGASTATAPRATASAMNARPSARLPGSAANRSPGTTWRLSAVMPTTSSAATDCQSAMSDQGWPTPERAGPTWMGSLG